MAYKKIIIFFTVLGMCITGFSPISIYPVGVLAHGEPRQDAPINCPHAQLLIPLLGYIYAMPLTRGALLLLQFSLGMPLILVSMLVMSVLNHCLCHPDG